MASGGGGGAGKVQLQRLQFVHDVDKASPDLMKACATGEHIKEATLTSRKAGKGQQEYLIVKMNDILITGVSARRAAAATAAWWTSRSTLQFAKVDLEYKPQKADGIARCGVTSSTTSR